VKLQETPLLPQPRGGDPFQVELRQALTKTLRETAIKVNQVAGGSISGNDGTATSVPTTGTWKTGDVVKKSDPVEAGSASSKYVITGWIRVTDGSANALNTDWLEMRVLTGN
jgi:hypothetical protein